MVDTVLEDTGDTMASERLMLNPRPRPSLTMDMVDTEATVEDMEAMVVMVLATAGATTASVRLRPSPTTATEDTVEATEDMEATGAMVVMVLATAGATTA